VKDYELTGNASPLQRNRWHKRGSGIPLVRGRANSHRVLRGGAFNNNERNVRCAYRNRNEPDERNNNIGFRVVVAHDFPRSVPELLDGCRVTHRSPGLLRRGVKNGVARPRPRPPSRMQARANSNCPASWEPSRAWSEGWVRP
jgi:hypothetical protein